MQWLLIAETEYRNMDKCCQGARHDFQNEKFYLILIFVFSFFWCIQSFKTQLDETWIVIVLISALQIDILEKYTFRKALSLVSPAGPNSGKGPGKFLISKGSRSPENATFF